MKLEAPRGGKLVEFAIERGRRDAYADEDDTVAPSPSYFVCAKLWGIGLNLKLKELACDYYLLLDTEVDHPYDSDLLAELERIEALLADQFARYLDMAIGGELRHAMRQSVPRGNICEKKHKYSKTHDKLMAYLDSELDDRKKARTHGWESWHTVRKTYGINALKGAWQIFALRTWKNGFGGHSWAVATKTLIDYLQDETTRRVFVDTSWGLQHNNAIIYDKLWNIEHLNDILDYNRNDDMEGLKQWATLKVLEIRQRLSQTIQPTLR